MDTRKKIFAIMGETSSGKDTITNEVIKKSNGKLRAVVSYTTRPKRDNETDGVEHYFVSPEEFQKIRKSQGNNIVAYTKIASNDSPDGYEYMATVNGLLSSDLYIIDPKGLQYLRSNFGDQFDIIAIYIYAPFSERDKRAQCRSDYKSSFLKRCCAEKEQFEHFRNHNQYDYIIYNLDGLSQNSIDTVSRIIDYELNERDIEKEFTTIMDNEYNKKDLIDSISYLKTISDFYTSQYINKPKLVRNVNTKFKMIRNIILSHLR